MNKADKQQIVEAMSSYMNQHGLSQNKFASLSGVNVSYISSMTQGRFENHPAGDQEIVIPDKWFLKIADYIGFKIQKDYWPVITTEQLAQMMMAMDDSRSSGRTKLLIGQSGSGKTYAIDAFCKLHPADAIKITVSSLHTINDIIDDILDALHLEIKGSKAKRIRAIAKQVISMRRDGLKPILIIDEGENMKLPALSMIKALYDALEKYCPIVLVGTDQLLEKIEKMKRKNKEGIPQFFRRFRAGISSLHPIDKSFNAFIATLDKGLQRLLRDLCDNYGELHDYLEPAIREADIAGKQLTEEFFRALYNLKK